MSLHYYSILIYFFPELLLTLTGAPFRRECNRCSTTRSWPWTYSTHRLRLHNTFFFFIFFLCASGMATESRQQTHFYPNLKYAVHCANASGQPQSHINIHSRSTHLFVYLYTINTWDYYYLYLPVSRNQNHTHTLVQINYYSSSLHKYVLQ